jgi:nitroimidazol reductase NimA-like FMN-containing flavoprotein (pyridoxamine 5'-phosphate oxidase superfamily)
MDLVQGHSPAILYHRTMFGGKGAGMAASEIGKTSKTGMETRAASRAHYPPNAGPRSTVRRHPERAVPAQVEEILRAGRVAHVAFAVEGQPYVLPFTYHFEPGAYAPGALYVHGAPAGRAMRALRSGIAVCVEVLLLDGLVASRTAKSHSMNYRSAMLFGRAELVTDLAEKRAVFEAMTARYFPGRTAGVDYHAALAGHLKASDLTRIQIEEWSAKRRAGRPLGDHDDEPEDAFGSCFVVDLPGLDG